ncbi:C2 domain-containing protein [Rhodocollybia butyracea]|uniref:C2 domain-containing protein n=1 Tax=Rhodocollybia butyracea TaxID=206335 RepID=A0A9P5TVW2_9AGAR|nr:C2 domain-containing protein [Rhodocollybia butyracea]
MAGDDSNGASGTNGNVADVLAHDAANGRVAVHTFDPDASPAQKAAAAGKGKDQLKSVQRNSEEKGEREVQIDRGHSNVIPTISIQDVDGEKKFQQQNGSAPPVDAPSSTAAVTTPSPPGGMPSGPSPAIPEWYSVGWRAVSGVDVPPLPEGEEKDHSVLSLFISEQFYGDWYHNAAIIVFAVFASHFLTRFHFGWGWLFIILAICNTYYTTSMERIRRNSRDDIQRELVKTRLASEHESADWINNFLDRFWLIYEPVLSATIVSSVDQILSISTPAFLDSMKLTTFTLGTKAPRIDKVRTFPKTEDDIVMMDWGISFTPTDISDMTPKQAAGKVNPKIVLAVKVGKGLASLPMPILLEDITFSGLMRIKMKLMTNFPHIQIVDISFLEKPVIDYVLKPIGGETFGFDIANMPGLSSFIREMTHATLQPMMYDPNAYTLNLEQLLSGTPLDAAIGVLQVTLISARGIKGTKIGGGTPDPYVAIAINNREELAHTKYKSNTYNPTWMETKFVLVNSLSEPLNLHLYDFNDHRKDALLGTANFELSQLQEDAVREGLSSHLLKDGKERGELKYDISYYPVLKPEEGQEVPDTKVGIVRLTIHQAKELDHTKSLSDPHEFLCADKHSSVLTIKVIDDRDFLKDPVVGYMSIKLVDLLAAKAESRDWFPLSNCKTGKIRLSAEWKPLNMEGSLAGADQYTPPIGVVKLHLDKATDVKNVEATLGGKSDPYVRVQVNNVTKGRTEVMNNNLNPVWDQILYIPVHSLKQALLLECMDYQHLTKDRSLGSVDLRIETLAVEHDDVEYPYKSTGAKKFNEPIRLDKGGGFKGTLHYKAEFVPALKLKGGVQFNDTGVSALTKGASGSHESLGRRRTDSDAGSFRSVSSKPDESGQQVPEGVTIHDVPPEKPHTHVESTDTAATGSGSGSGSEKSETAEEGGVEMSKDELLAQQSGIIVFNVISGQLTRKARVEMLLDDGYWPCFATNRPRSTKASWGYVGEGFVKELDFGQVWIRLNDARRATRMPDSAQTYTLHDSDGGSTSTVTIEARYIPVPVVLEARESINNQGMLTVTLLDARDILAADRGGKSDPFATFTLNGQRVFKSETKKKTLNPDWNEQFSVSVPSRVAADFSVELSDWNQLEQAKSLGSAKIDLADVEPFQATEKTLNLTSGKHGHKGHIRMRFMFQPEVIVKSRKNTSTFSSAGRAMTQIGGLPMSAGKGVFHGVTGILKKGHKGDESVDTPQVPDVPAGQQSHPVGTSALSANTTAGNPFPSSPSTEALPIHSNTEAGTLRVTVLDAKDLSGGEAKAYVVVRVGDKEQKTKHSSKTASPEWNEPFTFAASSLTPKLYVWIHDHKTLGKDKQLGDAEVDIWRHIKPEGINAAEVSVELHAGSGILRLRLEFDATVNPLSRVSSSSSERPARTMSIASPSRFSLSARRKGGDDE